MESVAPFTIVANLQQTNIMTTAPMGYGGASTSLSQILGRTASYLAQPTISLFTFLHHLGEMQDWSDKTPDALQRANLGQPGQSRVIYFINLRWFDAVMVATRPFLVSLARFGGTALSLRLRKFFVFCAKVASIAARESLALMRLMEGQRLIKGLTAFDRHFLVQCAGVLALSSVVELGKRDERLRFRECIEILLRIPGGSHGYLVREMRGVESKLERFAALKATKSPYVFYFTLVD